MTADPACCDAVPLADVIANAELQHRPQREPRHREEHELLLALTQQMAADPSGALQHVARAVLACTGAQSAGISVVEGEGAEEVFRWRAVAGDFERYAGQTMPRGFSPCGAVLDSAAPLLMLEPVRHYPYIAELHRDVTEVLLAPFQDDDVVVGTVWAVSHSADKRFDSEDLRALGALAAFASTAHAMLERASFGNPSVNSAGLTSG